MQFNLYITKYTLCLKKFHVFHISNHYKIHQYCIHNHYDILKNVK